MMKAFFGTLSAIAIGFFCAFWLGGYVLYEVYLGSSDHLKKEKIIEVLSRETLVYYDDGATQLGSLFGDAHRHYVTLQEIPQHMLDAVVAAEDDEFYQHWGVDLKGIARALWFNLTTGSRQGASTITQQTVKNIFGRQNTNYFTKFLEMINAIKLERMYGKKEILEFYLNQFHVAGNGHGLGIAAKYYFDKDPQNLSLTEAAFIAGSLKSPSRFNPFTKKSSEQQQKAKAAAKVRKNYVLKRMLENQFIKPEVYQAAVQEDVPYIQGKFQFNNLAVTDLVQRQLRKPEILAAVGADSIQTIARMGLRITTTLRKPFQEAAEYGVRQNLSRLEMALKGFAKEKPEDFSSIQRVENHEFYVGKILDIERKSGKEFVKISLGVPECKVTSDGVDRVARILDQSTQRGAEKSKAQFLKLLQTNDMVLVSIREKDKDGQWVCDIERRPKIQGAAIVLDKGKIMGMVGGFASHEFNRAVFARRQPGSTFKTLTFYSALQLGWSVLDVLPNVRSVYTWQNQYYYPRPDHPPDTLETTIAGAGAKSENLASVWLLAHLVDKLSFEQFKELLAHLEIYNENEPTQKLLDIMAQKFNAKLSDDQVKAGIFNQERNDLLNDFYVTQHKELKTLLQSMSYGIGFQAEQGRVVLNKTKPKLPPKEQIIRLNLLKNNYVRWVRLTEEAIQNTEAIKSVLDQGQLTSNTKIQNLIGRYKLMADGKSIAYMAEDPFSINPTAEGKKVYNLLENPAFESGDNAAVLRAIERNPSLLKEENLYLDGIIPLSLMGELKYQIEEKALQVDKSSPLEKAYWHADFRYSLGMIYAAKMAENMGSSQHLQWIPSFPLGANDVSLAELAMMYQTMLAGNVYKYFNEGAENQVLIVQRIEDAQGKLLWETEPKERNVVSNFYSAPILSVLRGTVLAGTGRAANANILLRSREPKINEELEKLKIRIPSFGKTGTTNDYVNATYVGFLPYPTDSSESLSPDHAYTIASYVGYDTNESMRKGALRVQGGSGALPAWIEIAKGIVVSEDFSQKTNWKKLQEKNQSSLNFDYGTNANLVIVPVHSSKIMDQQGLDPDVPSGAVNTNSYVDDYGSQQSSLKLQLHLPGVVENGIYRPKMVVSLFNKVTSSDIAPNAVKEGAPQPTPSPKGTPSEELNVWGDSWDANPMAKEKPKTKLHEESTEQLRLEEKDLEQGVSAPGERAVE